MHDTAPTDQTAAALASAIGDRVRYERQALGWTLDHLAVAAGVSRRMLVNVEHGDANPSVGTLLKISDALGVGLPALVAPPRPNPVTVTRAGEGATLWTGDHGGRGVLVGGIEPPDVVELWNWTLAAGDRHESDAHTPGTKELIQVLHGTIVIEIGAQTITLEPGDTVTFASETRHAYANFGNSEARFAMVVFEPGVGAAPRPEPDHA